MIQEGLPGTGKPSILKIGQHSYQTSNNNYMRTDNVTAKQQRILDCALELFSSQGFNKTSTAAIAKMANVSEGLIFRHYQNKDNLIHKIIERSDERLAQLMGSVMIESDPAKALHKAIRNPFLIPEADYPYWRIHYILRWDKNFYTPDSRRARPFIDKFSWALEALGYEDPEGEGLIFYYIIESLVANILLHGKDEYLFMEEKLLKKYKV